MVTVPSFTFRRSPTRKVGLTTRQQEAEAKITRDRDAERRADTVAALRQERIYAEHDRRRLERDGDLRDMVVGRDGKVRIGPSGAEQVAEIDQRIAAIDNEIARITGHRD